MIKIECDAVIFDLDGVLIDSSVCIELHWQQWAEKHNFDLAKIMQVAHGRPTIETMRLVTPHLPVEEETAHFEAAEALDTDGVVVIEGAAQLLNSLPVESWAIATSGTDVVATARLRHTKLPVPQVLVTADDVTHGKPNPEPYLLAAKRLGVSPENCVVFEDAPVGIESAKSAGMRVIAIASTHSQDHLTMADAIVEQLVDIQITENGSDHRLAVRLKA